MWYIGRDEEKVQSLVLKGLGGRVSGKVSSDVLEALVHGCNIENVPKLHSVSRPKGHGDQEMSNMVLKRC